jgi:hypothetical protein
VISESMWRLAGGGYPRVPEGHIYRDTDLGVAVINDHDWINKSVDFGGQDGDDKFNLICRTVGEEKQVITFRLPNEFGEYAMFKPMNPNAWPTWTKADGSEEEWPKLAKQGWPKPKSEERLSTYTGMPSQLEGSGVEYNDTYTRDSFVRDIKLSSQAQAQVGSWVNALFLYVIAFGRPPETMVAEMEDVIDYGVNGTADDVAKLSAEARSFVESVLRSGKPIDMAYWNGPTRVEGFTAIAEDVGIVPNLAEGKLTRLTRKMNSAIGKFTVDVEAFAQANRAKTLPPELFYLGGTVRESPNFVNAKRAEELLKQFRRNIGALNDAYEGGTIPSEEFDRIIAPALEWIREFDTSDLDEEMKSIQRAIRAGALLAVCETVPTRGGRYNDNLALANRCKKDGTPLGPFPYVMDFFRYFGFAADVVEIDDDGNLNRTYRTDWHIECRACGRDMDTTNRKTVLRWAVTKGLCKDCRR